MLRTVFNLEDIKRFWDWSLPSLLAAGGTFASLVGGWDNEMKILIFLLVIDYVTGIIASVKAGKGINSDVMFWGGIRKAGMMIVLAISVMLDTLLGNEAPVVRMLAVYFYIGREGLSVVENLGIIGVPMPEWLKGVLEQVAARGKGGNDKDGNKNV
jgi:toxin secretion/phage lysis holin